MGCVITRSPACYPYDLALSRRCYRAVLDASSRFSGPNPPRIRLQPPQRIAVPSESRMPRTRPIALLRRALHQLHSTPSGHINPATLLAYRDGELPDAEMQRIGNHLQHCPECRTQSELER